MKKLPENLQSIVWPVLPKNSFRGHSENVFILMLLDLDQNMRIKAVEQIEQIPTKTKNNNWGPKTNRRTMYRKYRRFY